MDSDDLRSPEATNTAVSATNSDVAAINSAVSATDPEVALVIEDVRPGIQADGGDVELVGVDRSTGVVTVRLSGACVGCPSSTLTMKFGIERIMVDRVPWVTAVQQVESHETPEWAQY